MLAVLSAAQPDNLPESVSPKSLFEAKQFTEKWWKPRIDDLARSMDINLFDIPKQSRGK